MTISLQIGKTYETGTGSRFKCVERSKEDGFFARGKLIYAHPQCNTWKKREIGDIYGFTKEGYFCKGEAHPNPGFNLVREYVEPSSERNDTVPPVAGRRFRRRDGSVVFMRSSATNPGDFTCGSWRYMPEMKGQLNHTSRYDLIEMLPEEEATPTDRTAVMTLRVDLGQVSDICNMPGVTVVNLLYGGEE